MRLSIRCLAVLAIVLMIPALAVAQTESGKISGSVTDQSGAVLPGVTVNLKSVERATTRSTVTNAQGEYVFASLVPGNYEVTAELSGFSTKQTRTNVPVGATVAVNLQMAVGAQTEVITVVGETAAAINTSTQDIATTVNETQIRELPTITRNPYDLVQLSGQASRDTESDRGTGYAINGAALGEHQHPARRLGEQRRLHGHGRPGRAPRLRAGVLGPHLELLGPVRPRLRRRRQRGHQVRDQPVPRHGLRVLPQRRARHQHLRQQGERDRARRVRAPPDGLQPRRPRREGQGPLLHEPRVHPRPLDRHEISWVPTPEFIAASAPATQHFFCTYGDGATINGPILTRGDVSAIVRHDAGAFNSLPAGLPVFGRVEKQLPIDAGGGDPQDQYQLVARAGLQPEHGHAGVRPLRLPGPGSGARHELRQPVRRLRHRLPRKNHNMLGSLTHVFSPSFTSQTKFAWNRLYHDQPLNGDPADALHEPGRGPPPGLAASVPRLPARGAPAARSPSAAPSSSSPFYQDFNWVKGRHDLRFGGYYMHMIDDRTFGAYANSVQSLNTTPAALPRSTTSCGARSAGSRARSTPTASRAAPTPRRWASRAS